MSNRIHVCSVKMAGGLDNKLRKWIQNPVKILKPYIREGMIVMDLGCGPGFFTLEIAKLVGESGRVIAADLQQGMLEKVRNKAHGTMLEKRIVLHQCGSDKIGLTEQVDFVLAFYVVHEFPDQGAMFAEQASLLKPNGRVLVVEPPFHVSRKGFEREIEIARDAGFKVVERPKFCLSSAVLLEK